MILDVLSDPCDLKLVFILVLNFCAKGPKLLTTPLKFVIPVS